jgi:hypothetical protein
MIPLDSRSDIRINGWIEAGSKKCLVLPVDLRGHIQPLHILRGHELARWQFRKFLAGEQAAGLKVIGVRPVPKPRKKDRSLSPRCDPKSIKRPCSGSLGPEAGLFP